MSKKIELFAWRSRPDWESMISNMMPTVDSDNDIVAADDSVSHEICDSGLEVFGITELKSGTVVRLQLTIDSMEAGQVKVSFEPFESVPEKPSRKRRRG